MSDPQALFKDANVFGPFLIPIALIVLEIVRPRLLAIRAWLKALIFFTLALGVLFSYSRAAWGSLVLGVLAMLLVTLPRPGGVRRTVILLSLLLAGAAVIVVLTATGSLEFFDQRAGCSLTTRIGSPPRRRDRLAEEHPFGIGPGQFGIAAQHRRAQPLCALASPSRGSSGLFTIVALMCSRWSWPLATRSPVATPTGSARRRCSAPGADLLLNSFFVDTLHWRHLWVVAALIWAGSHGGSETLERDQLERV